MIYRILEELRALSVRGESTGSKTSWKPVSPLRHKKTREEKRREPDPKNSWS